MKSPKALMKTSAPRKTRVLRKNPVRSVNKKNDNNVNINKLCNKTNVQPGSPLETVYTGYIANTSDQNGCYRLSISNSCKRKNESIEIPPSKRRKTINLCETIVLSDDDDDHDNHHNVNNNNRICNKNPAVDESSDFILLSPSQKTTRKTRAMRRKFIKSAKKIQNIKKSANSNNSKDGDEVSVIWSSACTIPTQNETNDHNEEKFFIHRIGNESNVFEQTQQRPENDLTSRKLREIIVDGLNVIYGYKRKKVFSKKGLELVLDYFRSRGHDVKIFIPQYERSRERQFLENWYREGYVIFTPSRRIAGKNITSHDDRFILDYATKCKGIVVSSDQYRDLWKEKPEWRETIELRLLPPTFVGDYVMFPEDPLGRSGPRLDEFLRH